MSASNESNESSNTEGKRECSFCHAIPVLRVTPGDPNHEIGICIDCALEAINILVAGSVQMLDAMKRAAAAKAAAGDEARLLMDEPERKM